MYVYLKDVIKSLSFIIFKLIFGVKFGETSLKCSVVNVFYAFIGHGVTSFVKYLHQR